MGVQVIVQDVVKIYRTKKKTIIAIKKANIKVEKGEFAVIYGPSGSGKSTLLSLIAGFDMPTKGRIIIGDHTISELGWSKRARIRRELMSYAPQGDVAIYKAPVWFNIALPLILRGYNIEQAKNKVHEIASKIGLEEHLERPVYTLSGGEMRRLNVARALVYTAQLYILDEPTASLDENTARNVWNLINEIREKTSATTIIASHDPHGLEYATSKFYSENGIIKSA